MLTIFSCPKPFHGRINTIQRNALRSWMFIDPTPEIILVGNEEGTADICKEFNLRYIPNVESNEHGTPLISSIFKIAQEKALSAILCYINMDIILLDDFMPALKKAMQSQDRSLLLGRRWDLTVNDALDFSIKWQVWLKSLVKQEGELHSPKGSDYFVFPKGLFGNIPDFAIGRPMWDNWMIYNARVMKIPVIDVTAVTTIVHQEHDYSHYKFEKRPWNGQEAQQNLQLAGGYGRAYTIRDATHKLTSKGLKKNFSCYYSEVSRYLIAFYKRHLIRDSKW